MFWNFTSFKISWRHVNPPSCNYFYAFPPEIWRYTNIVRKESDIWVFATYVFRRRVNFLIVSNCDRWSCAHGTPASLWRSRRHSAAYIPSIMPLPWQLPLHQDAAWNFAHLQPPFQQSSSTFEVLLEKKEGDFEMKNLR